MKTTEEFVKCVREVYGNKYNYSKVEYINNNTKVCIICQEHGEFWQTPGNHLRKHGCQKCAIEKNRKSLSSTKEEFILKARQIHGWKYDYSKVEYINNNTKVCIICPEHGEFWQTPSAHLSKQGCPICGNLRKGLIKKTKEEFIKQAIEVHGNKYDYSNVNYINDRTKVCIICPEHGEFWQTPNVHLNRSGCPRCTGRNKTFNEFKNQVIKKYGDIYDFSKAEKEYKNSIKKITIGFNKKFFKISPNKLLCGNNDKPIKKERIFNTEEFIQKARKIHGDKYNYSKVKYVNSKTKVCIICPEHGEFWQTPNVHLCGCGCSYCYKEQKRSKTEEIIYNFLNEKNINFVEQYSPIFLNNGLSHQKIDFYLPDYKVGIECQGIQHFKENFFNTSLETNLKRDIKKYKKCKENNIKILYFLERHVKMKDIINNEKYNNIYTKENTYKNLNSLLDIINKI